MPSPGRDRPEARVLLGGLIKAYRAYAGLSQRDLAARLGAASHTLISQFEIGATPIPPQLWRDLGGHLEVGDLDLWVATCLWATRPCIYAALFGDLPPSGPRARCWWRGPKPAKGPKHSAGTSPHLVLLRFPVQNAAAPPGPF